VGAFTHSYRANKNKSWPSGNGKRMRQSTAGSKPDRGILRSLAEVTNQHGETVMRVTAINFVRTRDSKA
jgi:hypothetical protein